MSHNHTSEIAGYILFGVSLSSILTSPFLWWYILDAPYVKYSMACNLGARILSLQQYIFYTMGLCVVGLIVGLYYILRYRQKKIDQI